MATKFVNFRVGLKAPKLSWLILMLRKYGIKYKVTKTLSSGEMLQVEAGTIDIATGILNQELVTLEITVDGAEEIKTRPILVTIDDLPDDHAFFEEFSARVHEAAELSASTVPQVAIEFAQEGTKVEGVNDDTAETVAADDAGAEFDAAIAQAVPEDIGTDDPDETEDEDEGTISWDFDDDEDEDEDDDEEHGTEVIDIPATVTESDPEFVAEEAPPKESKPRKMKEKKPAVDPDFETADGPEGDLSQPVDGTEFLQADDLLVYEDVQWPGVDSGPIRMYDVDSTNVSRIGAKILNSKPGVVTFYMQFKAGAVPYRYNPVERADWNEALNLAIRKHKGIQEASVGSFVYHAIVGKANDGLIQCQRLTEDGTWVKVLPKSERTKQIKARDK